jgi:hypothetical protein
MIQIPDRITCQASIDGQPVAGVLITARFGVTHKNAYSFIFGPTNDEGVAELSKSEIIESADKELELAMMDFNPLEGAFNGIITLRPMSREDIERAIDAYDFYKESAEYPKGYRQTLQQALEAGVLSRIEKVVIREVK